MASIFPRSVVEDCIKKLNVPVNKLTGDYRSHYPASTVHFTTFETVSDPVQYFERAMETELEHGKAGKTTDVTNDDPLATAKIAAAHILGVEHGQRDFILFVDYYDWLWFMEGLHDKAYEMFMNNPSGSKSD